MLARSIRGPIGTLDKARPPCFRTALGASDRFVLYSRVSHSRNCHVKSHFMIEDVVTSAMTLADSLNVNTAPAVVGNIAELDSATARSVALALKPLFSIYSLLMIVRIVMTWYPEIDGKQFPWSIAYNSTEFILAGTRKIVKPFNGLDVSPIVWVALLSFLNEILTGPQGILSMIERKGI